MQFGAFESRLCAPFCPSVFGVPCAFFAGLFGREEQADREACRRVGTRGAVFNRPRPRTRPRPRFLKAVADALFVCLRQRIETKNRGRGRFWTASRIAK